MNTLLDHPFLGRGFRPFFLLGALYSVISLFVWSGFYAGILTPSAVFFDPTLWHAHEMIYGFAIAIVAGFLLTAVANWTGKETAQRLQLATLCVLWLAGRVVMNVDLGLPPLVVFIIQGMFVPALAISLSIPLFKSWNKRNFVFLALLSTLFACDVVFLMTEGRIPLYVAVMVIITMISLIGGRVIPAFTVAALRRRGEEVFQIPQNKMDALAFLSLVSIIMVFIFLGVEGMILAGVAFAAFFIHILRLLHYHTKKILNDPMVWILHLGYIWVIVGLFLIAFSALGLLPFSVALHALTSGAIGSMTLGMMCRVALGHTGRNLIAGRLTVFAFYLMQLVAVIRVFGMLFLPSYSQEFIISSGIIWGGCFVLYIAVYAPMLWSARPDGRAA